MAVRVKICGLTRLEDAVAAVDAGADMLGFIFASESPRRVEPETVRGILAALGPRRRNVLAVGVFVNSPLACVLATLRGSGLDAAQLHGDEPPEMLRCSPILYKALRPRSPAEAEALAEMYARRPVVGSAPCARPYDGPFTHPGQALPAFLLDAYHPVLRGGTGFASDWEAAAALAARYPLLLAGGLTPGNVAAAIERVRPWGVDVSSGVEAAGAPGCKDHGALRVFISRAKENDDRCET